MTKGPKNLKFSTRVRLYKEGYLSVCVYKNVTLRDDVYYDIVFFRKTKNGTGKQEFKRGANLKPGDLPILRRLLAEAEEFLAAETT